MKKAVSTIIDGSQFFDFEKVRVQDITFDQLCHTVKENDVNTQQALKGIYHYSFIQEVLDMCKEFGYNTEIYDLFAAQNKMGNTPGVSLIPFIEEQKGERHVEAHLLRRIFANVRLKDFDDEFNTTNLSIAYHQRGIQVGFGNMVVICHNQCMLGADRYASTYGEGRDVERRDYKEILGVIRSWLADARHIVETDRARIEKMKAINVPAEQCFTLIGMLTAARVAHDTAYKEIRNSAIYPLNQAQITDFTEDLMLRYKRSDKVTAWDLYDAATNLYKAKAMDIPSILPQNRAFVEFLSEHFDF